MFLQKTKFPGLHQLGIHSLKHLTVDVIASAAKTNTQKHIQPVSTTIDIKHADHAEEPLSVDTLLTKTTQATTDQIM